ncbi:MAG: hypothetical protein NW202_09630 [Nitrospira sp.]|nr:hypothetical protein [Nitrospira sp.]
MASTGGRRGTRRDWIHHVAVHRRLAFGAGPSLLSAKTDVVLGSTLAGLIGWLSLRRIREQ